MSRDRTSRWLTQEEVIETIKERQRYFFNGGEKEFEEYVLESLEDICEGLGLPPIGEVERQKRINVGEFAIQPDIVVWHTDGTGSIFEIKCVNRINPATGRSAQVNAVGQLLLYRSVFKEARGKGEFAPRLFLVDQKIYDKTVCVFSEFKLPVTLVEIQNDRVFIPYRCHVN